MQNLISDNAKSKKLRQEIEQFSTIIDFAKLTPTWDLINTNFKQQIDEFERIKSQLEIFDLPDIFNSHFSDLGWIAYESMNVDLMKQAVAKKLELGIESAENFLAEWYNDEALRFGVLRLHGCIHIRERMHLVENAKSLYLNNNFEPCILLLLSVIDGSVQGISNHVGFFAESSDIETADSISGHKSGIPNLQKLFSKSRLGTNAEPITIPYRNGIIHGRDLNYGNRIVAAKCWSTLFAIADLDQQRRNPPKVEPETTWAELFDQIKSTNELKKLLEEWKPRDSDQVLSALKGFDPTDLNESSPERIIAEFVALWKDKNYGKMSDYLAFASGTKGKIAGDVRKDFGAIRPLSLIITKIHDEAPAISNISVRLTDDSQNYDLIIRCIFVGMNEQPTTRNSKGKWKLIQAGFGPAIYKTYFGEQ